MAARVSCLFLGFSTASLVSSKIGIFLSYSLTVNKMAKDENNLPHGLDQKTYAAIIKSRKDREKYQKDYYEKVLKHNPPRPPWLAYPKYDRIDLFWRMAIGETYLDDISNYFKFSSKREIEEYKSRYPEPPDWEGWYVKRKLTIA